MKRKSNAVAALITSLFVFARLQTAQAQTIFPEQRVPPEDFVVMSWGSTPGDPQQLEWMKQAGINIAGFVHVRDLPAFEKAGLRVFVSDPRINGYDFDHPLNEEDVRRNIESLAKEIGNSSAVIGFMLRDEPHARSMPSLGMVARLIRERMPDKWPYVNLFPARVSAEAMGTTVLCPSFPPNRKMQTSALYSCA